jgi:exopolyphosphatase/guanosine-5'-triphosphate,3'-diphosphate pyrophosphatase
MPRYASIDIGTQTIRLLIADSDSSGKLIPVYRDRSIIRLGEGMTANNYLQEKPVERALTCIINFTNIAHQYKTQKIFAVATSCVREAQNGKDFLETVYRETGVNVRLLSGDEEAGLSLRGVQSVFQDNQGHSLIIDIGGGSTELILTNGATVELMESLPLGVVHLSEKYFHNDPPLPKELSDLTNAINFVLTTNCNIYNNIQNKRIDNLRLIGTAGTITTLAAMNLKMTDYDIEKINGCLLTQGEIEHVYDTIILISSNIRINYPGLEPGREVVIIAGTRILLRIMDLFWLRKITVSDAGLLEGILLEAIGLNA